MFLWEQSEAGERRSWSLEAETESSSAVCWRGRSSVNVCVTDQTHTAPEFTCLSATCVQSFRHIHVNTFRWNTLGLFLVESVWSSQEACWGWSLWFSSFANRSQFPKCLMATEPHTLWTAIPERLSPSRLLVCLPCYMLRFTKPSSFTRNSSWKRGFSAAQGLKPLTSASMNVFKEDLNSFSVTVMLPGFVSSFSSSLWCDVSR